MTQDPFFQSLPRQAASQKPEALAKLRRSLRDRHGRLEDLLAAERKRPSPDSAVLQQLKRRKLMVKDALHALGQGASAGKGLIGSTGCRAAHACPHTHPDTHPGTHPARRLGFRFGFGSSHLRQDFLLPDIVRRDFDP